MRVYFSANARSLKEDIELYKSMKGVIQATGCVIAHDWVETAWHHSSSGGELLDATSVQEAMAAVEHAELLVAEVTGTSAFGVGFEVAQALQHKKPVLLLIKEGQEQATYAFGLKNELLTIRTYTPSNYAQIIEVFLKENTVNAKDLRFNFVIDRQIHNYLRRKSYETGRTKAEVVRDLLQKDMQDD